MAEFVRKQRTHSRGEPVARRASFEERLGSETSHCRFWIILRRRGPKLVVAEELKKDAARPRTRPSTGNYSSLLSGLLVLLTRPPTACPVHGEPLNDTSKTSRYPLQQPVEPSTEENRGVSCASRQTRRGSTYPACLLEVSAFCRRNL